MEFFLHLMMWNHIKDLTWLDYVTCYLFKWRWIVQYVSVCVCIVYSYWWWWRRRRRFQWWNPIITLNNKVTLHFIRKRMEEEKTFPVSSILLCVCVRMRVDTSVYLLYLREFFNPFIVFFFFSLIFTRKRSVRISSNMFV